MVLQVSTEQSIFLTFEYTKKKGTRDFKKRICRFFWTTRVPKKMTHPVGSKSDSVLVDLL